MLERDGAFLLVRRRNPPDAGLWGYPGGKIERGETIMQAACRELLEETGVVARPCCLLTPVEVFRHGAECELSAHFILLPVGCRWTSGNAAPSSDAVDARWFSIEAMSGRSEVLSAGVLDLAMELIRRQAAGLFPSI